MKKGTGMVSPTNSLIPKLKGYLNKVEKGHHLTALSHQLNDAEYRLWRLLLAAEGFDKNNRYYGKVMVTQEDIAEILGWGDASKVSRCLPNLLKKGMIKDYERGCIYVSVRPQNKYVSVNKEHAAEQTENALVQKEYAPTQKKPSYDDSSSLVSYKGNLVSSKLSLENEGLKANNFYENEEETEIILQHLTKKDIEWINADMDRGFEKHQKLNETEQAVCKVFLDGDKKLFEKSIVS